MYLKSIEVHGFKSFANKLVFQFKDGITGIVGPNGSGKSNVADAVRWVLGEQSAKQLRGTRMEDIIFAGTETRKPLGFAYVAITFDNSDHFLPIDFEEVTVARRVYRSGESEYLINGNVCLLKDIKEMFFDTGIGKEGYSIIGQGQIDKILSGKPEDRRELFDEAAGIVKYKRRKAMTVKNLDAERQNLIRVNDILSELELQVGPLQKQSEKAKKFLALHEELKSKDIYMFILDYERIGKELSEIKEKVDISQRDLSKAGADYAESRNRLDELEKIIAATSEELDSDNAAINDNKLKAEKLEGEIKLFMQQIESGKENEKQFAERLGALKEQLAVSLDEESELLLQKSENEKIFNEYEAKKSEAEGQINELFGIINEQETELDNCNKYLLSLMDRSSEIKSEQKKYETMLEHNSIQKAEMNQNLFRIKGILAQAEEQTSGMKENIAGCSEYIENKKNEEKSLRFKIHELEKKRRIEEENYQKQQKLYHETNSRQRALKNLAERYEGYGESVKKIMEKKAENKGIIGVVSDIISVDKKYETAVEISLGGNIQNIVTDTSETAKELIEYLKTNRLGRATFLPLSDITADADYDKKLDNEKGVLGPMSDFVNTDEKYSEVIKYLLGRFILVDNVDNALKLAGKYRHTLRIVTLSGEFLNVGGSISGGSYRNKSNLLGRKREISALGENLAKIKDELDRIQKVMSGYDSEHKELAAEISGLEDEINAKRLELNTLQIQLSQAEEAVMSHRHDYESAQNDGAKLEAGKKDIEVSLDTLADRLRQNEIENEKCTERINELNEKLEENKKKRAGMHDVINQIGLDRIAIMQTIGFVDEKLERAGASIKSIKDDIANISEGQSFAKETIDKKEKDIIILRQTIDDLNKSTEELIAKTAAAKENYQKLLQQQKTALEEREKYADMRNELEKEQIRLNNQNEKLQSQFDALNQYMWNEYELTYRSAQQFRPDENISYSSLKQDVQELRHKIKNLGDVNVNSIEEYKNVSERYNIMKTQHDDIIESEKRLLSFIEELEEKMRVVFAEKFAKINEQYNIVFRELFGGGKGMLELTADEDILDAGIRIIAQPPGKTLKSVSMLSGGEKALSAIAILFAIQNLKPSPFCMLDEIEAALDDSNIKRFAGYLNKLKAKSQYIVITHRQGTMAAADTLYGITMQEKGVSTLVSVDLVEQQLERDVKK